MWTNLLTFVEVPELVNTINKYGVFEGELPPYILVGSIIGPKNKYISGILCFAGNEFHAHLIAKQIKKFGMVEVRKTSGIDFLNSFEEILKELKHAF
jgi:hypothetical protein